MLSLAGKQEDEGTFMACHFYAIFVSNYIVSITCNTIDIYCGDLFILSFSC
jgi:hypothetical protein